MIAACSRGIWMHQHRQAHAIEHEPRYEVGEDLCIECDLVHWTRVRSDEAIVHASERHREAFGDALAQAQGCSALFIAFEIDVCVITDNFTYRNVRHNPSLQHVPACA